MLSRLFVFALALVFSQATFGSEYKVRGGFFSSEHAFGGGLTAENANITVELTLEETEDDVTIGAVFHPDEALYGIVKAVAKPQTFKKGKAVMEKTGSFFPGLGDDFEVAIPFEVEGTVKGKSISFVETGRLSVNHSQMRDSLRAQLPSLSGGRSHFVLVPDIKGK